MSLVTLLLSVLMAIGTSMAIDRGMERRGMLPTNFTIGPEAAAPLRSRALVRRAAAMIVVAIVLAIGIFAPLTMLGSAEPTPLDGLSTPDLFTLHSVFLAGLAAWYLLGFSGTDVGATAWRRQLGFATRSLRREIGIGVVAGVAGWLAVIALLLLAAAVVYLIGGQDALPSEPPEIIGWIVALPVSVRLALSLSAGVVEETFFRGFLQPRIGIVASSILFVMAHLSYDQPFLLLGVGVLSILFALLVRWRQSIWAAIVAHTVFDAAQLLFVIPSALDMLDRAEQPAAVPAYLLLAVGWI